MRCHPPVNGPERRAGKTTAPVRRAARSTADGLVPAGASVILAADETLPDDISAEDRRMARETVLFSAKDTRSRADVAAFLRDLAGKVESGSVTLRQGETTEHVQLPDHMVLEVELEDERKRRRGVRHCLEIELKWYDDMAAPAGIELG